MILADSITFEEGVQLYSEDEFSKTRNGQILNPQTGEPYIETGEIDSDIFFAIDGLKVGDISRPIEFTSGESGETSFRIVQIRNKTLPHVANLADDYSRIQKAALEAKKNKCLVDWVTKAIPKHYIELRIDIFSQFSGCAFLDKWKGINKP